MSQKPNVVRSIADLRSVISGWRQNGQKVALVPTMGALHAGHLTLVRRAGELADRTVVSIFVNPSQFAPHEDLARYPRDEAGDLARLATEKCDLVWAPAVAEMYPEGFATRVTPAGAAHGLESDFRPHFFGGVATVCTKLFGAVTPDVAVFGEKDYQQLCVIKQLVRDLNLPLDIVGVETAREPDGLALSSRNVYLSAAERQIAPSLHQVLRDVAVKARSAIDGQAGGGSRAPRATPLFSDPLAPAQDHEMPEVTRICSAAAEALLKAGFGKVDYIAAREADTLRVVGAQGNNKPLRVLAAAWLGTTRLIDNIPA